MSLLQSVGARVSRCLAENGERLEKSGDPQWENRLAKLPRRATNRERNQARPTQLAGIHRQGGYESFFREESFEYSILASERASGIAERDGRLRVLGAISFLLFPLPPPPRVIRRTRRCGLRRSTVEGSREMRGEIDR